MGIAYFAQWAFVADAYSPLLVILFLIQSQRSWMKEGAPAALKQAGGVCLSLVFIYTLMWVDGRLGIWRSMTWDYSTHTAFALVFVIFLGRSGIAKAVSWLSLGLYAGLMMYLHYHSLVDIVTTSVAVAPVVYGIKRLFIKAF